MKRSEPWITGAVLIVLVCMAVLCPGVIAGNTQNGGNSAGGSQGGYGPVSKSFGTEGTETWQVTFSGTDTYTATTSAAATSDDLAENSESSRVCNLQGSFPITVHHWTSSDGDNYGLANDGPASYPVSGSCTESFHIEKSGGSGIAQSTDMAVQASFSTAHFNFNFHPNGWGVQLSSDSIATGQEKTYTASGYTGNDQPFSAVEPASQDAGTDFSCNSGDSFWGGKPEFHREGAAYVIDCKGTNNVESEGQTGVVTLHITLDPDYVQGSPTKTIPTLGDLLPLEPPAGTKAPAKTTGTSNDIFKKWLAGLSPNELAKFNADLADTVNNVVGYVNGYTVKMEANPGPNELSDSEAALADAINNLADYVFNGVKSSMHL